MSWSFSTLERIQASTDKYSKHGQISVRTIRRLPKFRYNENMTKDAPHRTAPYTVDELVNKIYEDNSSHFDFYESMGSADCECFLHTTMATIFKYMDWDKDA